MRGARWIRVRTQRSPLVVALVLTLLSGCESGTVTGSPGDSGNATGGDSPTSGDHADGGDGVASGPAAVRGVHLAAAAEGVHPAIAGGDRATFVPPSDAAVLYLSNKRLTETAWIVDSDGRICQIYLSFR